MRQDIALDRLPSALQARDAHRKALSEILAELDHDGFEHKFITLDRRRELCSKYRSLHRLYAHECDRVMHLLDTVDKHPVYPTPSEMEHTHLRPSPKLVAEDEIREVFKELLKAYKLDTSSPHKKVYTDRLETLILQIRNADPTAKPLPPRVTHVASK